MDIHFATRLRLGVWLAVAVWLPAAPVAGITLGQVDDFQDATLQGWSGGSSPTNQPSGGPDGTGDRYLELTAAGFNLGAFNTAQWSGDYLAEGVGRVRFDLDNFGPESVSLRVVIFTPGCEFGSMACTAWSSTDATVLASGSGWVTAEFSLAEADMTRVLGTASFADTLQNVERILLRHDDGAPDPPGVSAFVTATLGVDNVTALPEPSVAAGLAAGALLLAGLRGSARTARTRPRHTRWRRRGARGTRLGVA